MSNVGETGTGRSAPAPDVVVRRLTEADRPGIRAVFAHDGGYALRVDEHPAGEGEVDELLASHPAGLDVAKESSGLFVDGVLVAVADMARGWPTPRHAYVGLLQVDARRHGEGWGRRLHQHLLVVARGWGGVDRLRLGVVDTNREAVPFWQALGYRLTGEQKSWTSPSGVAHTVDLMERQLA